MEWLADVTNLIADATLEKILPHFLVWEESEHLLGCRAWTHFVCVSMREFVFNHWKGREGAATAFLQVDEPEKTFSFPVDFCESCPFALDRSPCCHRALLSIVYCSAVVVTPRGGRLLLYGMEFRPGYGDGVYSLRHTSVSLSLSLLRLIPVSVFLANFNKLLVVRHLGILFIDERERREEKREDEAEPNDRPP